MTSFKTVCSQKFNQAIEISKEYKAWLIQTLSRMVH